MEDDLKKNGKKNEDNQQQKMENDLNKNGRRTINQNQPNWL